MLKIVVLPYISYQDNFKMMMKLEWSAVLDTQMLLKKTGFTRILQEEEILIAFKKV